MVGRLSPRGAGLAAAVGLPLLAVAVLGVEAVLAMRGDYLEPPTSMITGSVEPARPRSTVPLRLAVLGDSTVAGTGVDTVENSVPIQIAERVADALGRPVEVEGLGVSGARTGDLLETQALRVADADVVVVVIGSNDVTHVTPPWRLRRETAALLDALAPTSVVLGGIPLFGSADALAEPLRTVVGWYANPLRNIQREVAAAREHVTFVNIAREASPRFRGVPEAMSEDGFHPAAVGYGFWADALAAGVVRVLEAE